jgi:peptidyl-prolyl cis-trans isomerase A (cyclophilin A)
MRTTGQLNSTTFIDYRRVMQKRLIRLLTGLAVAMGLAFTSVDKLSSEQADTAKLANPAALKETAPATFTANFDTSAGPFVITVNRDWAPHGADRFYNLVKNGFFNDVRFFRAISGFMVQFGIHGTPAVAAAWRKAPLPVDKVVQSNRRGFITYAMAGSPDTRTTQVFINFRDNTNLDKLGFAPFGQVTSGMENVDKIFTGYGEGAPSGQGPEQGRVQAEGNAYLMKSFPKLDYVKSATIGK